MHLKQSYLIPWLKDTAHHDTVQTKETTMHSSSSDQPVLAGATVVLRPLEREHSQALLDAAGDGKLWEMTLTIIPGPDSMTNFIDAALADRDTGTVMPFVICHSATNAVLGSTRFWKMDPKNKKLEIGHTWLSVSAQRSGVNIEAKYLLLTYAFETLGCVRVQFTTDVLNEKSRKAILNIGATQEGIVRHERIMPDGRKRNSVRFSIIDDEWPGVKTMLERKMTKYTKNGENAP